MNRRSTPPFTLQQAAEDSPTLASLIARARDAGDRLRAVEELIPPLMRPAIPVSYTHLTLPTKA